MSQQGTIYLLCLERTIRNSAKHYLGWSSDVEARQAAHKNGRGAKFLRQARAEGIAWDLVRSWENKTRHDERKMKRGGALARYCPRCCAAYRQLRNAQQRSRRARDGRADRPRKNPRGHLNRKRDSA